MEIYITDNNDNIVDTLYTLNMPDNMVETIYRAIFIRDGIKHLEVVTGDEIYVDNKITIPLLPSLYIYKDKHIYEYRLGCASYDIYGKSNVGSFYYEYFLENTYIQVEETVESIWGSLIDNDKIYLEDDALEELLRHYIIKKPSVLYKEEILI